MSPIELTPGALILLAFSFLCIGALAATTVRQRNADVYVREAIFKAIAEANCMLARDINCKITLSSSDGKLGVHQQISTNGTEVSAQWVQSWLESRGLVMAPKGKDFKVKVQP